MINRGLFINMDFQDQFTFQIPTRIYYRPDGLSSIGDIIGKDYRYGRVFLVYGRNSLKRTGNYQKIVDSLNANSIVFDEYSGIDANPDIEDVKKMTYQAREFKPDMILAVGGGSVIDASKLLSHTYFYKGNFLDFNKHVCEPINGLPLATIPTISGSGSEMSDSCVISDRKTGFKGGFNHPLNYPTFSLLDPTLTYTVSDYQTAIGIIDMFSHSFERYFSKSGELEPSDSLALAVMKEVVKAGRLFFSPYREGHEYEIRKSLMILAALSHNGFTSFGKQKKFVVHGAEHRLSGRYSNLYHGEGIGILMPIYLVNNEKLFNDKLIEMGKVVFELNNPTSSESIASLVEFLDLMPVAHTFDELDFRISEEDRKKAELFLFVK